jgi:hypothetical protein
VIVDALVGFGYPFERLLKMTFSELNPWLKVAIERNKPK